MDKSLEANCLSLDLNSAPIRTSGVAQPDLLIDQLNRVKSENKKLTETLFLVCENYNALQNHMMDLMRRSSGSEELSITRKRKSEAENSVRFLGNDASNESICDDGSPKRPKEIRTNISRVFVRTDPADTSLVVKDGYHWRKYGQKVTKDNPSPRAYFKCSFAPTCQVKKKVQRSIGDPLILVAAYEGEHNHQPPLQAENLATSTQGAAILLSPEANCFDSSGSRRTFDLINPGVFNNNIQRSFPVNETNALQKLMVEQMASSLTRNPSFTAALVAAIPGRILSHDPAEQ